MFEICAHPHHSTDRSSSAMIMLDSIIRTLSLTMVDVNDPHTSTFSPGKVPAVISTLQAARPSPGTMHNGHSPERPGYIIPPALPVSNDRGCNCNSLTLGEQWTPAFEHTPLWTQTPGWSAAWSEAEIRKESCRRLCWSSMTLAAGHSAYSSANRGHTVDLFISDPSNVSELAFDDRPFLTNSAVCSSVFRRGYGSFALVQRHHMGPVRPLVPLVARLYQNAK